MQATTWKDKITDPSNLWLAATRAEQDGRFAEATVLYLRDAADCLTRGLEGRAALSCSCAASCLERTGNGNAARHMYLEAAKIYEEQAEVVFGRSTREALWLLQEAHDHFIIAGDAEKAAQVYEKCASLAIKSNPFVTVETLDKVLRVRPNTPAGPVTYSTSVPQTPETSNAIEEFLRLRDSQVSKLRPQPGTSTTRSRRRPSVEKSIIS